MGPQTWEHFLGSVHATQEKFKDGAFNIEVHRLFSIYITPETFSNATIAGLNGFVFEQNSGREISRLSGGEHIGKHMLTQNRRFQIPSCFKLELNILIPETAKQETEIFY